MLFITIESFTLTFSLSQFILSSFWWNSRARN